MPNAPLPPSPQHALTEFITSRPLFMRPSIEDAPCVAWTRLISHAARSPHPTAPTLDFNNSVHLYINNQSMQ